MNIEHDDVKTLNFQWLYITIFSMVVYNYNKKYTIKDENDYRTGYKKKYFKAQE